MSSMIVPTKRIVAIRPGALGDTLLTFPALALLRRRWPDARLAFVARGDALGLARASGLADGTSPWEAAEWSALFAPRPPAHGVARDLPGGADAAVAWLPDPDGGVARMLAALGARQVVVAPGRPPAALRDHAALVLARGLLPLEVRLPASAAELAALVAPLRMAVEDERAAGALWASLGPPTPSARRRAGPPVAVHPGSGGDAKRWPPERFAALLARLAAAGRPTLLVEGPQDAEVVRAVLAALPRAVVAPPVVRGLPLGVLAALLARCAAFVGNDAGVAHLAGLVGVPALALFGPTEPRVWAPLGPRAASLRAPDGQLTRLGVDAVWEELVSLLA